MKMKTKCGSIASLIAALTIVTAGSMFAHDPKGKADPMVTAMQSLSGPQFEQSFLQQMIQHHRSGIDMAKLAISNTQRAELRQFAEKMISMQEDEIDKMSSWLKSWYNESPKGVVNDAADKQMKKHMSMLSPKRDSDFEKSFLAMMPKHHHVAVEMAEQAEKKATHGELKEFAANLAKDQEKEIQQMKSWAQSWFG